MSADRSDAGGPNAAINSSLSLPCQVLNKASSGTSWTGAHPEMTKSRERRNDAISIPAFLDASDGSPASHRAAVLGSSAEVLYNPHKLLHFSLLDADKLNPNRPFMLPAHNIQNRCGFNLKQRVTVRFMDPEVKKLAGGDRGVSFYRTALSRQVDHGSLTRHLLAGKGQLESNRKPYILSSVIGVDVAAPPPLKGEKSVSAELAAKGIDAEEAPKSLDQALSSRLMNKVLSTLGAMRKPHR
ncbi:MAG TPA: hypothetical protein VE177_05420 [Candidatus Binatus sp.]|nr:hypothetical protein [Candidatus Binatus sp.]